MHGTIPAEPQGSIFTTAQLCSETSAGEFDCTDVQSRSWFSRLAQTLWPKKPAASLQYLTGAKERACHYWVSGREPPAGIIVSLLRSNDGARVLDEIMRGCTEPWWIERRAVDAKARAWDRASQQLELELQQSDGR